METTYRRPLTDAERAEAFRYLVGNPDAVKDWSLHLGAFKIAPPPAPRSLWGRIVEKL